MTAPDALDGLVYGMDEAEYHAHPALSQSAMKTLLDCPARYVWERDHPTVKDAFDFGSLVHADVLGVGEAPAVLDFSDWRTKAARDARDEARAAGLVPILAKDHERVEAAADAVRAHPTAGWLLGLEGESEVSMFWTDLDTGYAVRGRADRITRLPDSPAFPGGRPAIIDVKTTGLSAEPGAFMRHAASIGYHLQAAHYIDGYEAITGEEPVFLFVAVETTAPHLVSVVEFDTDALDAGRNRVRDALATFTTCTTTGQWPGYTETGWAIGQLPNWALYEANANNHDETEW